MGVVKLSSSGKQVQFITDEGVQYGVAKGHLLGFLANPSKPFILLDRMVDPVAPDRFPKSKIWNPNGSILPENKPLTTTTDVYSQQGKAAREEKTMYVDKEVQGW